LAYAGSVLQHAKRQGLILDATGPAEARRLLKDEGLRVSSRERTRRLSDDELQRLIDACDAVTSTIPLGAIVRFALSTSMRRDEILRLLRADVDADKRIALVRGRKHPKDQARVDEVPLMPVRRGKSWPKWDALKIIEAQPKGERVFPYVADSVSERFEHACRTAGLVGLVFHLLRHEALSRYAERGLDVMRLQLVGGHRDLRALARYARLTAQGLVNEK
jgi:integrase